MGFVAGTLVHTDKGLVPIEQLKVGDSVLSKPESAELTYKPVVNTFVYENQEIWLVKFTSLNCYTDEQFDSGQVPFRSDVIVGTPNQLFWEVGAINHYEDMQLILYPEIFFAKANKHQAAWERLDRLEQYTVVVHADGFLASVYAMQPIFVMKHPDRGFLAGYLLGNWWEYDDWTGCPYVDLSSSSMISEEEVYNKEMRDDSGDWRYPVKTRTVYNLEVADYNNYFIGKSGILVAAQR